MFKTGKIFLVTCEIALIDNDYRCVFIHLIFWVFVTVPQGAPILGSREAAVFLEHEARREGLWRFGQPGEFVGTSGENRGRLELCGKRAEQGSH